MVFEGDTAKELAKQFCDMHNLDEETEERLEALLNQQISSVLTKIQEEDDASPDYERLSRGQQEEEEDEEHNSHK